MSKQQVSVDEYVAAVTAHELGRLRAEWDLWHDPERLAEHRKTRLVEIEDEGRVLAGDRDPERCQRVADRLRMPIHGVKPQSWQTSEVV